MAKIPELREHTDKLQQLMAEILHLTAVSAITDEASFDEAIKVCDAVFKPFANRDEMEVLERINASMEMLMEELKEERDEMTSSASKSGSGLGIGLLKRDVEGRYQYMIKELNLKKLSVYSTIFCRLFYHQGIRSQPPTIKQKITRDLARLLGVEQIDIKRAAGWKEDKEEVVEA
jgi:response regulator RpfG family c-di-GMP phosphodiesterase